MYIYYLVLFLLSLVFTGIYAVMWRKRFDVFFTLVFTFIPIVNMGYVLLIDADNIGTAITAQKIIYLGGCYQLLFAFLAITQMCRIKLGRVLKALLILFTSAIYLSVLSIGHLKLFYDTIEYTPHRHLNVTKFGVMHDVFIAVIAMYFAATVGVLIYCRIKKPDVPNRIILLMFLPEAASVACFAADRILNAGMETLPAAYCFGQVMYLLIVREMCMYDIADSCIDSLVRTGSTGLVSFDNEYVYLGCNETAEKMLPELAGLAVDTPADMTPLKDNVLIWLRDFVLDNSRDTVYFHRDDMVYLVKISHIYNGRRKRGYQLNITDDTANQKYIELINKYNEDLAAEVEEKTAHIAQMHDKLILGMAAMIESRDNSTGGHIMRTSDVVKFLCAEMMKQHVPRVDQKFCNAVIKAAPMHDLGKIAVDDAILRKPGKLTDEEYEKMKSHAAEGARIVHEILKGTDDDYFRHIAENVAHYHHERWDGTGYPEGLAGEQIPLEARIMAVADVYDTLVSKRVYKEGLSFEEADRIIMGDMGKHFDKWIEPFYVSARPLIEQYYLSQKT